MPEADPGREARSASGGQLQMAEGQVRGVLGGGRGAQENMYMDMYRLDCGATHKAHQR